MKLTQTSGNFERVHIPPRIYDAVLVEIREGEIKDFDNPALKKKVYFWVFEIAGRERTVTLGGMTSPSFNPKSKLYEWAKNILGTEPPQEMETEHLYFKPCKVQVDDRERDGVKYSGIKAVLPGDTAEIPF